jgi:putative transposase
MEKAFKFRLYPTKEQEILISKNLGCSRFVYNYFLNKRIEMYKNYKETLTYLKCSAGLTSLKSEFEWLKEVDSISLQQSLKDLDKAYQNFFKSNGFPKFKSKHNHRQSYRTTYTNNNIDVLDNRIKLPKLGCVKFAKSKEIQGRILNATVSKNPSGKYFVSICCTDVEMIPLPKTDRKIGVDLGIKEFAITSEGQLFHNPKNLKHLEKRLAKLQKSLSRKQKGSNNRNKARIKVAKLHEKIANQRKDFLHKVSTQLIRENQSIIIEDLKVNNMIKNHKLAKSIAEVSWSEFRRMLEHKAKWYSREIIIAPSNYASSQLCSNCGNKSSQTKDLSCRTYICSVCGLTIDRDLNASKNLLRLAM